MNKRLVWSIELFLWAILIFALILGFTYSFATADQKNSSYYMFFKDVDGLTKGSPVRMMGYQIGYVRDVKVFEDNIFVSFLVTEKNINIPNGSSARVEFYGLGGSKSLEIEPSTKKYPDNSEVLITKSPYRIADYYKWGSQINATIEQVSVNATASLDAFVNSGIKIPYLMKSAQNLNSMVQSFVNKDIRFVDDFNNKVKVFNEKHKDIQTVSRTDKENAEELTEDMKEKK